MKKFFFLLLLGALGGSWLSAQTDLIAHRSHSGQNRHFSVNGPDNPGLSPEMELAFEYKYRFDTLAEYYKKLEKLGKIGKSKLDKKLKRIASEQEKLKKEVQFDRKNYEKAWKKVAPKK